MLGNKVKVPVSFEGDNSAIKKTLSELKQELEALRAAFDKTEIGTKTFNALAKNIKEVEARIASAGKATSTYEESMMKLGQTVAIAGAQLAVIGAGMKTFTDAAMKAEQASLGLNSTAEKLKISVGAVNNALRQVTSDGLISMTEGSRALQNLLQTGFGLEEAIRLMRVFKDSAAFNRQASYEFGEAVVVATEGVRMGNSVLSDAAGITKNLSQILKEAGKSEQDLSRVNSDATVRRALYNGLIKEGEIFQGNAAKMTETAAGAQAKFNSEMQRFNAQVGKEFLQAIRPIVVGLTDAIRALNQIDANFAAAIITAAAFARGIYALGQALTFLKLSNPELLVLSATIAALSGSYVMLQGNVSQTAFTFEQLTGAVESQNKALRDNKQLIENQKKRDIDYEVQASEEQVKRILSRREALKLAEAEALAGRRVSMSLGFQFDHAEMPIYPPKAALSIIRSNLRDVNPELENERKLYRQALIRSGDSRLVDQGVPVPPSNEQTGFRRSPLAINPDAKLSGTGLTSEQIAIRRRAANMLVQNIVRNRPNRAFTPSSLPFDQALFDYDRQVAAQRNRESISALFQQDAFGQFDTVSLSSLRGQMENRALGIRASGVGGNILSESDLQNLQNAETIVREIDNLFMSISSERERAFGQGLVNAMTQIGGVLQQGIAQAIEYELSGQATMDRARRIYEAEQLRLTRERLEEQGALIRESYEDDAAALQLLLQGQQITQEEYAKRKRKIDLDRLREEQRVANEREQLRLREEELRRQDSNQIAQQVLSNVSNIALQFVMQQLLSDPTLKILGLPGVIAAPLLIAPLFGILQGFLQGQIRRAATGAYFPNEQMIMTESGPLIVGDGKGTIRAEALMNQPLLTESMRLAIEASRQSSVSKDFNVVLYAISEGRDDRRYLKTVEKSIAKLDWSGRYQR